MKTSKYCKYCESNAFDVHVLARAPYITLKLHSFGGDLYLVASGDNDCIYEPKFCPECGRNLKEIYIQ